MQPLLMMLVYWLVFSVLLHATNGLHDYPQFILTGLATWTFFQGGVVFGTASIVSNGELIKKVWFPRAVIPTAVVLAQITTALVMYAVLVPVNVLTLPDVPRTFLAAVPMLFGLLLLTMGLGFTFATLNVFYRDIEHLLTVLFLPWFFLTPVLYSLESIPAAVEHAVGGHGPAVPEPGHAVRRGHPRSALGRLHRRRPPSSSTWRSSARPRPSSACGC